MLELLQESKKKYPELTGVIHCFTSNADFAAAVKELGFYISASGIITFKSATDIADVFKTYPLDKILIETDSPYLAPVPYRGKVTESTVNQYWKLNPSDAETDPNTFVAATATTDTLYELRDKTGALASNYKPITWTFDTSDATGQKSNSLKAY